MNNIDIELRLQNIINTDRMATKQLAIKTKRFHKKLHFLANKKDMIYHTFNEKKSQLLMTDKLLNEHHEMLKAMREAQTTLRNQIYRLRKKVTDLKNQTNKSESVTPDDRFVYTKNALKKSLLGRCTKIRFIETKIHNRISLMGYVGAPDKLLPFQTKIAADSEEVSDQSTLWEYIEKSSPNSDHWSQVFANENRLHTTF